MQYLLKRKAVRTEADRLNNRPFRWAYVATMVDDCMQGTGIRCMYTFDPDKAMRFDSQVDMCGYFAQTRETEYVDAYGAPDLSPPTRASKQQLCPCGFGALYEGHVYAP